ncbi:phosphogluconate dehydrogenase C-terminal domain-containing protein [Galbitalea sp. SE-J8]|uniref:phosphogluconate dehydrogenase C-terminal domain-containing protein n=1 Tax=Galbitalea sp. SE-J8 TaxID=3054952 RepID=UPI00259D1A44|nr:phosphogluconate dehydrogenase C-terminal domain-containing protein [Galbitalea sp. SE-J8]MDM4761549.1 phosphogluconate dehydrogenase C-terminal domain-containing protein [Galbitalea sp. SE-J8]
MTVITILGAGGNMGRRIAAPLRERGFELRYVEPGESGRLRLESLGLGIQLASAEDAVVGSDVVIFAVPDAIVRHVAADIVPKLGVGTSVLFLDPAAIAAGRIAPRPDVSCFVTHPTHPPLYSLLAEPRAEQRADYWGGGLAQQAVVFAHAWGPEEPTALVERVVIEMFAPVSAAHRITVEQMAMLEPALSETLTNGCIALIREGLDRVIAAGVPEAAAHDFCMGHLQIGIALLFGQLDWKLSDGAQLALAKARGQIVRDDWYRIFEPEAILESVRAITGGDD